MRAAGRTIVITGFMGAGKTTVAAALSERLGCPMIDLDRLIEGREGRTARVIIEEDGEPAFREVETLALVEALGEDRRERVVALGGGAWTLERNRALVEERGGLTVWLDAPFKLCWERIGGSDGLRPLAKHMEGARRLYDARRPFYDQATLRVEVRRGKSPEAIAAEIEGALPKVTK